MLYIVSLKEPYTPRHILLVKLHSPYSTKIKHQVCGSLKTFNQTWVPLNSLTLIDTKLDQSEAQFY